MVRVCPVCTRAFSGQEARCPDDGVALVTLETGNASAMGDLTGQVVDGRYKIEGVIGRGGMGMVYACRHVVVGKHLAMKVLKPGLERSEDVLARFIREAQAANAVRSPHIAESSDFGQLPSGHFFVVMELLEGMSLAAALKARALTRDQLLFVFSQMADTLAQTHEAGIVHRDLKPDNVYLVRDPNQPEHAPDGSPTQPLFVKLLDFGVAKLMNADDSNLTQSGVILGTPYYMAPEQARGQAIDHRADIYSLGVMMYHAFTGRLPFIADSAVAVLTAHAIDEPVPPSAVSTIDPGIEQLILRSMAKAPAGRPASMREVGETLRALRRSGGNFALPPSGAFPRIDTQSGASLSGPHSSIASRMSGVGAIPPAKSESSGGKMLLVASLLMLTLGGGAAFFVFAHKQPITPTEAGAGASSAPVATALQVVTSDPLTTVASAAPPAASSASAAALASAATSSSAAVAVVTPGGHPNPYRGPKGGVTPPAQPPPAVTTSNPTSPPVSGDVRSPFK
jgi:serine/threonine protein kinase